MIKKLSCLAMMFVMLLSVFGLVGCTDEHAYAREGIEIRTGIEVPIDSKILYHCRDEAAFLNGARAQYTVFEFKSEPIDWLKESHFLEGRDKNFEMYFTSTLSFLPVKIEDIPKEFIPDFENGYFWVAIQNVYFFYNPRNLMLIVHILGH